MPSFWRHFLWSKSKNSKFKYPYFLLLHLIKCKNLSFGGFWAFPLDLGAIFLCLDFWSISHGQIQKFWSLNMLRMPSSMQPCEKILCFLQNILLLFMLAVDFHLIGFWKSSKPTPRNLGHFFCSKLKNCKFKCTRNWVFSPNEHLGINF